MSLPIHVPLTDLEVPKVRFTPSGRAPGSVEECGYYYPAPDGHYAPLCVFVDAEASLRTPSYFLKGKYVDVETRFGAQGWSGVKVGDTVKLQASVKLGLAAAQKFADLFDAMRSELVRFTQEPYVPTFQSFLNPKFSAEVREDGTLSQPTRSSGAPIPIEVRRSDGSWISVEDAYAEMKDITITDSEGGVGLLLKKPYSYKGALTQPTELWCVRGVSWKEARAEAEAAQDCFPISTKRMKIE